LDRLDSPGLAGTDAGEGQAPRSWLAALWLGLALATAGVAAGIAAVYIGMRDVMEENGGFCASGGPYEISSECSSEQIVLLFGGIVAVLLFTALHSVLTELAQAPRIGWSAICGVLFLVLGWNFVDLGIDPPREEDSVAGWLVSGVVFWLMAVGFLAPAAMRAVEWLRRRGEPEPPVFSAATVRAAAPGGASAPPPAGPTRPPPTRLVTERDK
jgi:hypothetical protein